MFDVAERISHSGISVFLSQACDRDDWDRHVHNALSFADEILAVIAPFQTDLLNPDTLSGFPNGHLVWLAIGSAWARGIPIRGLLKGLSRDDVIADRAIPGFIKRIPLFDSVEECADDLFGWLPERRPVPAHGLSCHVCICRGDGTPQVFKLKEQLTNAGFGVEEWVRPAPNLERYDAAIIIPGGEPGEYWKRFALSLVRDFVKSKKPVALLALPDTPEHPELTAFPAPAAQIEYRESDDSTFLQVAWTLVGYQQYDLGTTLRRASVPPKPEGLPEVVVAQAAIQSDTTTGAGTLRKGLQRRGVFISYSHSDEAWLDTLLTHLAPFDMEVWTDRDMRPGELWHQQIQHRLDRVQVAVLLVSPAYLGSPYIKDHELPKMLTRAMEGGLVIFWIPVIDSGWRETGIAKFQAAHDPSQPLRSLEGAKRDTAWVHIAKKLSASIG
jgi:TIR domain